MSIFSLITAAMLLGCTPTAIDELPSPEGESFALTIKSVSADAQSLKVDATFFRLAGESAPSAVGVAVRRVGVSDWRYVDAESVVSPFTVIVDSLESQTMYEIVAYAQMADGERFISNLREVETDEAVYDPTPHPDSVSWYELPDVVLDNGQQFVTHFTEIDGARCRNYSMLYDNNVKIALWVAYPLHTCYMGSSGRSEEWAYDPVVSQNHQMNMYRSGFIDETGYTSYDRGHQLPSADRTVDYDTNAATFYYTNMTPQQSSFNRGVWSSLEEFVRENVPTRDTLYVVTGCAVTTTEQPSPLFARHKSYGGRIAVPRAYFKVLARSTVAGQRPNDDNAECIGFWLPNVSMTGTKFGASMAVSVSELEELTGFEFFPELSEQVKQQLDTSDWDWE